MQVMAIRATFPIRFVIIIRGSLNIYTEMVISSKSIQIRFFDLLIWLVFCPYIRIYACCEYTMYRAICNVKNYWRHCCIFKCILLCTSIWLGHWRITCGDSSYNTLLREKLNVNNRISKYTQVPLVQNGSCIYESIGNLNFVFYVRYSIPNIKLGCQLCIITLIFCR